MTVRIGTSGWSYDHWAGVLYPPGMPPRDRLQRYVSVFDTVELNASFYRWPAPPRFESWNRRLPPGFAMTVKAPRGLTHARKLYAPEEWLTRISAGLHELGDKRAVVLVQLPPKMERDDERLGVLPRAGARMDARLRRVPASVVGDGGGLRTARRAIGPRTA